MRYWCWLLQKHHKKISKPIWYWASYTVCSQLFSIQKFYLTSAFCFLHWLTFFSILIQKTPVPQMPLWIFTISTMLHVFPVCNFLVDLWKPLRLLLYNLLCASADGFWRALSFLTQWPIMLSWHPIEQLAKLYHCHWIQVLFQFTFWLSCWTPPVKDDGMKMPCRCRRLFPKLIQHQDYWSMLWNAYRPPPWRLM